MRVNFNLKLTTSMTLCLLSGLLATDCYAKSLYKSVSADGKVTYSNHPPVNTATSQNISSLKNSPQFSVAGKQAYRPHPKSS